MSALFVVLLECMSLSVMFSCYPRQSKASYNVKNVVRKRAGDFCTRSPTKTMRCSPSKMSAIRPMYSFLMLDRNPVSYFDFLDHDHLQLVGYTLNSKFKRITNREPTFGAAPCLGRHSKPSSWQPSCGASS